MRIGELAAKAGVNIQSVRFYERRRILREPVRAASGYRVYGKSDLDDICFIKQCQELGFTLKEIQPLLQLGGIFGARALDASCGHGDACDGSGERCWNLGGDGGVLSAVVGDCSGVEFEG